MKFAFQMPDGSVTILGAAPKQDLERVVGKLVNGRRVLTDAEYRSFVLSENVRKGVIPVDAVPIDLPDTWTPPDGNRAYRAAWKMTGNAVDVDMVKARVIHMNYIRAARDKKLDETDKQLAALDGGAVPPALRAQRQRLRDLPQVTDLSQATTVAALKAIWPPELA